MGNLLSGLGSMLGGMSGSGGTSSSQVTQAQMALTDQIQVEQTVYSMAAEKQKSEWNKWKILQDTQTKIYEIQQEVTLNRAKTSDKMFGKWDEYVKS